MEVPLYISVNLTVDVFLFSTCSNSFIIFFKLTITLVDSVYMHLNWQWHKNTQTSTDALSTFSCDACLNIVLLVLNFTWFTGYSEPSSAGCKQYTVGFTAPDDSSSTATAEIAVNGMDPPELGFSPAESATGTSGQSHVVIFTPSIRLYFNSYQFFSLSL